MIPEFLPNGNLPPGIHDVSWQDFCERFGYTAHRKSLLDGLASALKDLSVAGCKMVYIDGSFVTNKEVPGDYDLCWSIDSVVPEKLNPVFLNFSPPGRTKMKDQYKGDLFPAEIPEGVCGKAFLDFFQTDKNTGEPKGIVSLEIGGFND
ncbi:MAG: hypothetical protein GY786_08735 [Proteobacteria bacterium]|nr:hypothetical protein [Pseudomonadota bacterium]